MSDIISPARNYSLNKKTRKNVNFAWQNRRLALRKLVQPLILAPGNWMRTLSVFLSAQCITQERTTPTKERMWKLIPAHSSYIGGSLSTAISKKVTRLVRHFDQEERQSDAAVHWDTTRPKLLRAFADRGARDFSETDWLRHIHDVSNKTRFEHCEGSKKSLTSLRGIQGHTCGITIAPELMGTLWFLTIGKSLRFTGVVPSTSTPSLRIDSLQEENRAIGGDKASSSHLPTLSGEMQMKKHPVMTSQFPGKCTITAVGNLSRRCLMGKFDRTQDQGLRFWQTKSSAIIVHNLVPADCIYRVIYFSERRSNTIRKTLNPSTCAEGDTLENLAAAAVYLWWCVD